MLAVIIVTVIIFIQDADIGTEIRTLRAGLGTKTSTQVLYLAALSEIKSWVPLGPLHDKSTFADISMTQLTAGYF